MIAELSKAIFGLGGDILSTSSFCDETTGDYRLIIKRSRSGSPGRQPPDLAGAGEVRRAHECRTWLLWANCRLTRQRLMQAVKEVVRMPLYEYRCQECGKEFEKLVRSISSTPEVECPHCAGQGPEGFLAFWNKVRELWWPVRQCLRSK